MATWEPKHSSCCSFN